MKLRKPSILTRNIAALLALGAIHHQARAVDGTWITVGGGSWPVTTNWAGGTVATGVDAIANFSTVNLTANATVTLDGARTVGSLLFQDATTASNDWILNTGTAGPLTLDVTTGPASIQVLNRTATIGAVLAGNDGIAVGAASATTGGTLILGAANTFTGGLSLLGTVVQLNNATAAGPTSNLITLNSGGTPVTRLVLNAGLTIGHNIVIGNGSDITNVAGRGVIERTGTGAGTINGAITINNSTSAGGHFVGGGAGSELILNGAITSAVQVTQRDGFVRYSGGGAGYSSLIVTGTAQVGATNGISTDATVSVGVSATGILDLNGFNQSVAGLIFGQTGNANTGVVNLGARTLTLTGDVSTSTGFFNAQHSINAAAGGAIDVGAGGRTFTIADSAANDDLAINDAAISGAGGIMKTGFGTLALKGVSIAGALAVDAGTLQAGRSNAAGTVTTGSLTFGAGFTNLKMKLGPGGDLITTGSLVTNGTTLVTLSQFGGALPAGVYPMINYMGVSPGLGGFTLDTLPGHTTGTLVDTGSAIAYSITANDRVIWDGTNSDVWSIGPTGNWRLQTGGTATDYIESDDVIFRDGPVSSIVNIPAGVSPSNVSLTNTTATSYTFVGDGGINGATALTKTGNGTLVLRTQNGYTGATVVSAGILELDHDATGNLVLTGTSGVDLAAGTTLQLTRDDGGFTFSRNLSGTGAVDFNPHSVAGGVGAHSIVLSGNNSGFTGPMRLLSPITGTYRINGVQPAGLGGATIAVQNGAQIFTAANGSYANDITIAGTGFQDSGGFIGALRLESGSNWTGDIVVDAAGARIGAHNTTGTVSGSISGGDLNVNGSDGTFNNNYTVIFTGSNSYGKTTIGGGSTATGVLSRRLNIGNGGTSGTLGTGVVEITGDGQNGVLGFDRSDGYALAPGQTITGVGAQPTRVFVDLDTQGAGFSDSGNSITLGAAMPAAGGFFRLGQARANTRTNITGTLIAEKIQLGGVAAGINATMNIGAGANVSANFFTIGEAANATGGVVNQTGGTVNVLGQLRAGHFGTETGTYNMIGGVLTLTGASPNLTPSTLAAGGANATGDNNINGGATAIISGGGIYLGIDGTGIFNHTGGTVTTNWIVLDNRGNTGVGANMADGIDRYSLSGATSILNLRSTYGIIARNTSTAVSLGGGTIRVDNSGTGTGTGANLAIPLDATLDTVAGTTTALDTNGSGNRFTLLRDVRGNGTLNLTGGGTIALNTFGFQNVSAALGGNADIVKQGAGVTTLAGSGAGYSGAIAILGGRLNLPAILGAASISVSGGASLGGEPTVPNVTLGTTAGANLFFDPNTSGALTATNLTLNGTTTIDFSAAPNAAGPYTVLNYGTLVGTPTFALANAASYRAANVNTGVPGTVTVGVTTKALTWTGLGTTPNAWDINTTQNWTDGAIPETFFFGDTVAFTDAAAVTAINVSSGVSPFKTTVNSATNNFTFTSAGVGIAGVGDLEKSGSSVLTLVGTNTYGGQTVIRGGDVATSTIGSLGNGSGTNSIALSGGGRLIYTGSAALDLGINRSITVGTGGGALAHNNPTAATITIPGNLIGSGSDNLSFQSNAAGAGTFVLTGNNSGFTGSISVDAPPAGAGGLTVLRIGDQMAVPAGGSITLNYPVGGVTGNSTTLDLPGISLPAAVTVNMTSLLSGVISLRSSLNGSGTSSVAGPITASGDSIVQIASAAGGSLSLNGPISAGTGGFTGTFFIRGAGVGAVNGVVTLPNASFSKTDAGIWTVAAPGSTWAVTGVLNSGSVRLGADNGLAVGALLSIGQSSDAAASLLEMNGFDQAVNGLTWIPGNANSGRAVGNSNTASQSVLTLDSATDQVYGSSTGITGGNLTGNIALVKNGTNSQTLAGPANNYTGDVTVNSGTLIAGGNQNSTALGSPATAGRTVTVNNSGSLLSFITNNVFGNGVGNANLPAVVLNAGTSLVSTRYNVLGPIALNGAALDQSATDSGGYEGFQFKGAVTVGGATPSTISTGNGKANHLDADTLFTVANSTGDAAVDLLISTPLRNQSGDFGSALGGLTKAGAGTMEISSFSTYTGPTTLAAGTLLISGSIAASATTVNGGTLTGGGSVGAVTVATGTIAPGAGLGTLSSESATFSGTTTFSLEINSSTLATDLLASNGAVDLNLATLTATDLGSTLLPNGTTFRFINAATGVTGQFAGIGDLATIAVGANLFQVDYDTNSVSLIAVPEPTSVSFLIAGLSMVAGLRRSSRRSV